MTLINDKIRITLQTRFIRSDESGSVVCFRANGVYLFFHSYYTFETKKDSPPHMPTCYKMVYYTVVLLLYSHIGGARSCMCGVFLYSD